MKRMVLLLFFVGAMVVCCKPGFAVQDEAGSASVNAQGQTEGVNLSGGVQTLTVSAAFPDVYTDNRLVAGVSAIDPTASAISTGTANQDTIVFDTSSTVYGTIGSAGNFFKKVDVNDGLTVNFLGTVYTTATADSFNIGSSTVNFNSGTSTNIGAITFTDDGTASFAANTQITGAIITNTVNTGTLSLGSGSKVTGAVTGIKAINVTGGSNTAGVTGTVNGAATQIYSASLLTNELSITGGILTMATNGVINTTLASATVYGHILVEAGNASNLGTGLEVRVTVPTTADFPVGTKFYIVQSTSGTGALATVAVVNPTNPLYTFEVDATAAAGDATITTTGIPLLVPVADPPADPLVPVAAGVASALADTPSTADIIEVRAAINALTNPIDVVHAEAQLAPSTPALTAPLVTFQGQRQFQTLWLSRLDMCQPSTLYKEDGSIQSGVSSGDEMQGTGDGVWAKGFGYLSHQDARSTFVEYNMRTYGLMAAYDKPIGLNTRAGLGLGYAWSKIKSTDANTEFNTYDAVAYIGHDIGPWFVHGSATFGWNEYSDSRHINFTGVNRTANSDHNGQDYTVFFNTGYRFPVKKFMITPVASLQYTYSRMEGYTEEGAGDLNLKVDSKDYNFLQSGLGFKAERELTYHGKSIIPEMHFRWLHMLNNPRLQTTSAFSPEGSPKFTTSGLRTSRETYNAGLGLTFFTRICRPVTWSLEGVYDYDWRTDGFYSHMATARVTFRF